MYLPPKEFWDVFKKTEGALSTAEALCIIQIASLAPSGNYICLGAHKGKDSLAAAYSLPEGNRHYLVDPCFDPGSKDYFGKDGVATIKKNIYITCYSNEQSNYYIKTPIEMIGGYSYNVISKWQPYSYVFWDSGEHGGETLEKEKLLLEDAVISGGIICSHDIGNQFTSQKEAMDYLVNTGKYEWIDIDWKPIFDYVKEHDLENDNSSWHIYNELPHPPNFVGAVRRK